MEEGVTATEILAFQESSGDHETKKSRRDEAEDRPCGEVNLIISTPVSDGRRREVVEEEDRSDSTERDSVFRRGEQEGKGVIGNFISNLVPKSREAEVFEAKAERMSSDDDRKGDYNISEEDLGGQSGGGGGDVGGGIINNLISNLFQQIEAKVEEADKGNGKEEKVNDVKTEEDGGGGGGSIIDNLVSHLPKNLSDDMAPPPDEASLLIHSIVHD